MYAATRSTQRDFCHLHAQQIVHHFRFLRLAASTSKLTCTVFFIFFWPIRSRPANQLFLVYGDASGSICQLLRGQKALLQRTSSARTRTPHCSRCCGLRLEITSLCYASLQRPDEAGEDRRHVFFHIVEKRSSGARAEEAQDSGLELVTPTWPTIQHTRAAWATLALTFF